MRYVTASMNVGPPPLRARSSATRVAAMTASTSLPSTRMLGMPKPVGRSASWTWDCTRTGSEMAQWLFWQKNTTGAWKLAAHAPGRFAALVPICGGADERWAPQLARLPTWVFHGARDSVVPAETSRRMVQALEAVHAPVTLTVFDDLEHDCWERVYQGPDLYDWLLSQRNPDARAPTPQRPS